MKILFIDPVCPTPYTTETIAKGRLGGTEATCSRVIKQLAKRGFDVAIEQRNRVNDDSVDNVCFVAPDIITEADIVVTLRDGTVYRKAKERFPNARHYLWMHDVVSGEYTKHLNIALEDEPVHMLAVSQWHKFQIIKALEAKVARGTLKVDVIYNPVDEGCFNNAAPVNSKRLIFFSSPHKGLDQVLEAFEAVRKQDLEMHLVISNPGYFEDKKELPEGVSHLSAGLTHAQLMDEVRASLCMFYTQTVFEETFGLVYAEANAVGTPVIAHNLGAASEVLDNPKQLIDCTNLNKIVETTLKWSQGERPTVGLNKLFKMDEVIKSWVKLFKFDREFK